MGIGKPLVLMVPVDVVLPPTVGLVCPLTEALADPLAVVDEELAVLAELPTLMS